MKKLFAACILALFTSTAHAGVACSVPNTFVNGTIADANQVNANFTAVLGCLLSAAAAGSNSDITALNALVTPLTPTQGGSPVFLGGTSGGAANAQTVTVTTPSGFSQTADYTIIFIAGFTNTGALTLTVNGGTSTNFYVQSPVGPQAMIGGEVVAGQLIVATFDGTEWVMISNGPQFGGFGPGANLASAATTDVGTIGTHNAVITGVTPITSFGASASVNFPIYLASFNASTTITYNQTNCGTVGGCILTPGNSNIVTAAGDVALLYYLGKGSGGGGNWQVVFYQRISGSAPVPQTPQCGFSGLTIAPASTVTVSWAWNSATLLNASNVAIFNGSNSGTLNISNVGVVNGLDTGTVSNNTFYYLWGVSNGTTTGLIATANPSPALPSPPTGYTYLCYAGAVKTGGAATFYGTKQSGNETRYIVGGLLIAAQSNLITMATGVAGVGCATATPTWVAQTVRGSSGASIGAPASASLIDLIITAPGGGTGSVSIAPNPTYGTWWTLNTSGPNTFTLTQPVRMFLETNSVQYCSIANATVSYYGWRDAVNAN
jgi:hypothetical protein